jgi:ABC-type molybdate transport system substrate-binding protein
MKTARSWLLVCGLAVLFFVLLVRWQPEHQPGSGKRPLLLYCAAGLRPPVESTAQAYESIYGVPIQIQYGGSGTLLSNLRVAGHGDLFLAGDDSYIRAAQTNGLVEETIPLGRMTPVIAVRRGNPEAVHSVEDLLRVDVALANPDAAAIGRLGRELLRQAGLWDALRERARVFKPTVMEIANDIRLGIVDAGIIWDATASQYPDLEPVRTAVLSAGKQIVTIGVLQFSQQAPAALRFARYLGAPERGLKEFARFGYQPVDGDSWAERPEVVLFSGAVNRPAIEETIHRFEQREGVHVTRVYNGCGVLLSQIKAGLHPDAYLAADISFLSPVQRLFSDPHEISETDLVLLVARDNPLAIRNVADLARPGLRVGIANPEQSALGLLTERLFKETGLRECVRQSIKVQAPTADLLVSQMRTRLLDVVIVYAADVAPVRESLTVLPIRHSAAKAIQPYAISRNSKHRLLMERLRAAICSMESRRRYEALGFRWRADAR